MGYKKAKGGIIIKPKFQKAGTRRGVHHVPGAPIQKRNPITGKMMWAKGGAGKDIGYLRLFTNKNTEKLGNGDYRHGSERILFHNNTPEFEKKLHDNIKKAILGIMEIAQDMAMTKAYLKYHGLGLDKHDLTGNTRASVRSMILVDGRSAKSAKPQGMPYTKKPKVNVLRPDNYNRLTTLGDASLSMEGPSFHRYKENYGKKWEYYTVELLYHPGEKRRVYSGKLVDTGIIGTADVASDMELRKILSNGIKELHRKLDKRGNENKKYGSYTMIALTAMSTYYVDGLDKVVYEANDFLKEYIHNEIMKMMKKGGYIFEQVNDFFAGRKAKEAQTVKYNTVNTYIE